MALVRLFSLRAKPGALSVADLYPLRAALVAARDALDGLRFAAEDAIAPDPLLSPEAQRLDIRRHGRETADALALSVAELDVLAAFIRAEKGGGHVA